MPRQKPKRDALQNEPADLSAQEAQEQLADAQAQIDALQTAAADAEARAATARAQLAEARQRASLLEAELTGAQAELASAQAELVEASAQLAEARSQLRDAALKYRDARLAAVPHIPAELVPVPTDARLGGDTLDEIDQQFEAAQRLVGQVRDKLESETRSARVPLGSPTRRGLPDLSALSPAEKIKLGLQRFCDRERA